MLRKVFTDRRDSMERYFGNCTQSVKRTNLEVQQKMICLIFVLFFVMVGAASLIIHGWQIHPVYYLMIPLLLVFGLVTYWMQAHAPSYRMVQVECIIFYCLFFLEIMLIDVIPYPGTRSSWFPIMLVALSVVYIDRMIVYVLMEAGLVALYIWIDTTWKLRSIAESDTFNALASMCVSLICAYVILGMRGREAHNIRERKYENFLDSMFGVMGKEAIEVESMDYFRLKCEHEVCALLMVEVNDFAQIQSRNGKEVADEVIHQMGNALRSSFRSADLVGEDGDARFVILMRDIPDVSIVDGRCENVRTRMEKIRVGNIRDLQCSIGAVVDPGMDGYESMYKVAEDALYEAKLMGRGSYVKWAFPHTEVDTERAAVVLYALDTVEYKLLKARIAEKYRVLEAHSGNEILSLLSHHMEQIALVGLWWYAEDIRAEDILVFIRSRLKFASIPVMVLVNTEEERANAEFLGARKAFVAPIDVEDVARHVEQEAIPVNVNS